MQSSSIFIFLITLQQEQQSSTANLHKQADEKLLFSSNTNLKKTLNRHFIFTFSKLSFPFALKSSLAVIHTSTSKVITEPDIVLKTATGKLYLQAIYILCKSLH